jgi:hypothetical protein
MTHWMEGDWPEDCEIQPKTMDGDVQRLVDVCWKVIKDGLERHREALSEATTDVAEWINQCDDPRENGWVGDDGLP